MLREKILILMSILCMGLLVDTRVHAEEAVFQDTEIEVEGFSNPDRLQDKNKATFSGAKDGGTITLSNSEGIGALYVEFDVIPSQWTLTNPVTQKSVSCGENAFLHEFVNVASLFGELPQTLVMSFDTEASVAELYGFTEGEMPNWVQCWEPPCEEADLLLLSSHSDDEQLFFAGVLPYYAVERQLKVQVAYVVQHFEANGVRNHIRPHEQLDGLWAVGVRNYPVMSDFPDLYAESKDRDVAFAQASAVYEAVGITYQDFLRYITESFRRFKPLVVASHDLKGEYGHGTHVLCSTAITEAIELAADPGQFSVSAEIYGTWQVEKVYLHLYEENPIVMDFDIPLESLGGKTAFQVTQEGFGCHESQHWTWFYKWIYGTEEAPITKASQIRKYSPCNYGLYYTAVGADMVGGDFMENVETYEERALAAALKAEEEARKVAELEAEKARQEAQRLETEKAQQEAERLEAEKDAAQKEVAAKLEAEKAAGEKTLLMVTVMVGICVALTVIMAAMYCRSRKKRK